MAMLTNTIKAVTNSINGVVALKTASICSLGRLPVFPLLISVLASCTEIPVNNLNTKDKLFNTMIVIVAVRRERRTFSYETTISPFSK